MSLIAAPLVLAALPLADLRVESYRLDLRLDPPHTFSATAEVALSGVDAEEVELELNRGLRVRAARLADGTKILPRRGPLRGSSARSEGRPWRFRIGPHARDGRATLVLEYEGHGERRERDWRGVLLVREDEARMSEQTVFYPQIPLAPDGPRVQRAPAFVTVDAPADLEVFVPGIPRGVESPAEGRRRWSFELPRPSVISVVAGRWVRRETRAGETPIVTLLCADHAHLGPEIARELEAVIAYYEEAYGVVPSEVLGVAEMKSRGSSSYNWASQALIVLERGALRREVPRGTLAHEAAHLWWGQAIAAHGPGERFLTESLAEYSSWRWLERGDPDAGRAEAAAARERWLRAVEDAGVDAALAETTFRTPAYYALAYYKGPLVLRYLEARLGRAAFDAGLRAFAERYTDASPTLADFEACLCAAAGVDTLEAPWLHRAGHAVLELQDCSHADGALRGSLVARPCDAHPDAPRPGEVDLLVRTASGPVRAAVQPSEASFTVPVAGAPQTVALDPDVTLPAAVPEPLILDGGRVVRSEPAAGARDVPAGGTRIVLELDRPLREQEWMGALVPAWRKRARAEDVRWPRPMGARLEAGGRRLVVDTAPWVADTEYLVVVGPDVRDAGGGPVLPHAFTFRTAPSDDREPPRIVATAPVQGAAGVALDAGEVRVTFSETMQIGTGFPSSVVRENEARGLVFPPLGDRRWEDDFRTAVWRLREPLAPGTTYVLPLRGGFRDLAGNAVADTDWSFTTAPE